MNLTIKVTTRHKPRCPLCMRELQPYAIAFAYDTAFCSACVHAYDLVEIPDVAAALQHHVNPADITEAFGLTLWTPRQRPPVGVLQLVNHGDPQFLREQIAHTLNRTDITKPPYSNFSPTSNPEQGPNTTSLSGAAAPGGLPPSPPPPREAASSPASPPASSETKLPTITAASDPLFGAAHRAPRDRSRHSPDAGYPEKTR